MIQKQNRRADRTQVLCLESEQRHEAQNPEGETDTHCHVTEAPERPELVSENETAPLERKIEKSEPEEKQR